MKASYDLTADDLAAFSLFHQSHSPVVRRQRTGCLSVGVLILLLLPGLVLIGTEKPLLHAAKDIWPLFAGPVLFLIFVIPYIKWRTANLSQRLLREGRNAGFYGQCTLSLEDDGIRETKESGDTIRKWSAVEKVVVTADYLFVYTSGIEAFVVPLHAFSSSDEVNSFHQYIATQSGVTIQQA